MKKDNSENYILMITLNLLGIIILFKLYYFFQYKFPGEIPIFFISLVQDLSLIIIAYFIFYFAFKIKSKITNWISIIIYLITAFSITLTSIIYTSFITDLINYPINLFRVDKEILVFFMKYFINLNK